MTALPPSNAPERADISESAASAYARDAAALARSRELAQEWRWQSQGGNERAIWAELRNSGFPPFQTQVDLGQIAFKCTCPSRIQPCKHGVGLLLLFVKNAAFFQQNSPTEPDWVTAWIEKRLQKRQKTTEIALETDEKKRQKQADDKQKRTDERVALVTSGMDELEKLLLDLTRTGLLHLPEKTAVLEQAATRLIDAKSPALATRVRRFAQLPQQAEWHQEAIAELGQLWLIVQAFRQMEHLPENVQEDVKTQIGWTYKRAELLQLPDAASKPEHWLVAAQSINEAEGLVEIRSWLLGLSSGQTALQLDYFHVSQSVEVAFKPGELVHGSVVYYPSNAPQRAIFLAEPHNIYIPPPDLTDLQALADFKALRERYAAFMSLNPWATGLMCVTDQVRLAQNGGQWALMDENDHVLLLSEQWEERLRLHCLALTGGHPARFVLLYEKQKATPLGLIIGNRYYLLA